MNGTNSSQPPTSPGFRIAIVGGGIGGLSAALFLDHVCRASRPAHDPLRVSIDVYEQAAAYREVGAGVGLGLNAARLLHLIPGVGDGINAINGARASTWFTFVRWDDGRTIKHVDGVVAEDARVKPSAVARSEFLDLLLGKIREGGVARLHTNKRFASVEDLGEAGVEISFQDGTTAQADLLIGCDGIHSEVRKQFIQAKALYSGKIAYRGVVPVDELPRETWPGKTLAVIWHARHRHFLVYPISAGRSLNIVGFVSRREDEIADLHESWSGTCDRRELEEDFADFEPTVGSIIRLMPARPSRWRLNDHEPVPQWSFFDGKVALLGDACHAMTPHQGAGAGQAVEDGYILAKALAGWLAGGTRTPLRDWMALYQRVRLPRAQKVVETSRQAGELYELQAPDMIDLPFDDAAALLAEKLPQRMKWIWDEDLDSIYENHRQAAGL